MLLELKVANFAIIENIHIQFRKGLNILTGETGAGKSVLLKSLSLLMGVKGSTESIRTGFHQASIEGSFDISDRSDIQARLHELGIEIEDSLLVVKRVLAEEKSRVYINGSLSTLNTLRDLVAPLIEVAGHAAPLIEMTGQFDNRNLLSKAYHLDLLDQYAGTWDLRGSYSAIFSQWHALQLQIKELENSGGKDAQRLDFLTFQRDEIAELNLQEGEDVSLEQDLRRLKNSSRWTGFIEQAEENLTASNDSATARISAIIKKSADFTAHDNEMAAQMDNLKQAQLLIEDSVFALRRMVDNVDNDPKSMDQLEQRLSNLRKLQKKYGASVTDILAALTNIDKEIEILQNKDAHIAELGKKAHKFFLEIQKIGKDLHSRRLKAAPLLADSINAELADLNMKGVTFHVQVLALNEPGPAGQTEIEFMSQTSPKDPPRPLAKFASGGELSRILLSLKRVVGSSNQPRTYLFDEVDTGVSGPTAEKVGKKLHSIAKGQQVICITHLPQVAAYGDAHFFIQKGNTSPKSTGSIAMEVNELAKQNRVNEIARLISGEKISKTSLAHAKELLQSSGTL